MIKRIRDSIRSRHSTYRYQRLAAGVGRPSFDYQTTKLEGFHSQCGQDKWVVQSIFPGKIKGVFVDVGAHDGITFSNTFYLEKLGWTGLAVEPMPETYKKLTANRDCQTINGCIAETTGVKKFRLIEGYAQMLSGLVDEYDPRHLQRITNELEIYGGSYVDIDMDCFRFNDLMRANNIGHIDYLSIDVEGVELKVLETIDFKNISISVIGVENNYLDYKIPSLLKRQGFNFHSVSGDEFYVNESWIVS